MRVTADQRVVGAEIGTVGDFWQWAFSDLCDDDIKGWFAEWLVASLLRVQMTRRISWADSDIIIGDRSKCLRIEVKSTAHFQSWKLLDEYGDAIVSKPLAEDARVKRRFPPLMSRKGSGPVDPNDEKLHKSDLYVFALQSHTDPDSWNALDVSQWEFFFATKNQLAGKRAVTVKDLEEMEAGPLTAEEFSVRGRDEIRRRGFGEFVGSTLADRMADQARYSYEIDLNGERME